MSPDALPPLALTDPQRAALIELGSHGSGGDFDQYALAQLFVLGLIEVRSADRRLALTERGRAVFDSLSPAE
jgi:hypothetical protein